MLELLAQVQLSKLDDAAAAEQAASHATELREDDFVAWMLVASARGARGQHVGAARALVHAAQRWPSSDAQAAILSQAADLMETGGETAEALSLFEQVAERRPHSLPARLGIARAALQLGEFARGRAGHLEGVRHLSSLFIRARYGPGEISDVDTAQARHLLEVVRGGLRR